MVIQLALTLRHLWVKSLTDNKHSEMYIIFVVAGSDGALTVSALMLRAVMEAGGRLGQPGFHRVVACLVKCTCLV